MSRYFDYHKGSAPTPDEICFDNLLYHALMDYLEDQGRMLAAMDGAEGTAPLTLGKKVLRRYQKRRAAKAAVTLLVAGALTFTTMFGTVEAFRVNVINTYFDIKDDISEIMMRGQSIVSPSDDICYPEYIPKGFSIISNDTIAGITTIQYGHDTKWINFRQQPLVNINYHDAEIMPGKFTDKVNECPARISVFNFNTSILWYSEDTFFQIRTNISVEEALKIAQSVTVNK